MRVTKLLTQLLSEAMRESEDPFVRSHAMAPFHDAWIGATFAGVDVDGNPTVMLDMNGGGAGGGAQTVADGLDAAATFTQLSNGLPDVEVNELVFPVLYLWRRINVNSGGPGRFRGGQGIEFAWTPWGTPGGQEHVFSACWQVPPRGIDGGYPGGTSGFVLIQNSNLNELIESGRALTRANLRGEEQLLACKQVGIPMRPGTVFIQFEGGGGGLGDPLTRDPASVAQDVQDGYISREAAERGYGVVLKAGGAEVDAEGTRQRREAIRQERLRRSQKPYGGTVDRDSPVVRKRPIGFALLLVETTLGTPVVACAQCGARLADIREDWRTGCALSEREISEALADFGVWVKRRDVLPLVYLREYFCPVCGATIETDVAVR